VDVPEDIGGDGVEAHGLGHFEACVPVLAGDAGVVKFAGEDFEGLAVEGEVVGFGGEGVVRLGERGECDEGEDGGEEGSVHRSLVLVTEPKLVHLGECFKGGFLAGSDLLMRFD